MEVGKLFLQRGPLAIGTRIRERDLQRGWSAGEVPSHRPVVPLRRKRWLTLNHPPEKGQLRPQPEQARRPAAGYHFLPIWAFEGHGSGAIVPSFHDASVR